MKNNIVKFVHVSAWYPDRKGTKPNTGWYFTEYNAKTKEGFGWFGDSDGSQYDFERRVFDGQLMERSCGYGSGCFWTDWRDTIESVEG